MSHRNGKPKPSQGERTWRRYRTRHEISTPQDEAHHKRIDEIKNQILEWLGRNNPKVELEAPMAGKRNVHS